MKNKPQSLIDTKDINPEMCNRVFRYAKMLDINKPMSEQNPAHQIMCREKGPGHKWQLIRNGAEPLMYPTEEAARADVKKINNWIKENSDEN